MLSTALARLRALFQQLTGSSQPLPEAENATSDQPIEEPRSPELESAPAVPPPNDAIQLKPEDHLEPLKNEEMSPLLRLFLKRERHLDGVIRGLFIGDIEAAHEKGVLKELGVTHIVTALDFVEPAFPEDFDYLHLPLEDTSSENIAQHFDDAFHFIDAARQKGGKVFVHCYAGISRSSTIVIYYLSRLFDVEPVPTALRFLRQRRPEVEPNYGFVRQLLEAFEKRKLTGKW